MNFSPNLLAHCDLGTKNDAKKRKEAGGGRGARPFYFINKAYPTTTARSSIQDFKGQDENGRLCTQL